MKCRCIDKNCKTVADEVEVIERYEAILGEGDMKKKQTEQSAKDSLVDTMVTGEVTSNFHGANSMENVLQQMQQRLERIESNMNRKAPTVPPMEEGRRRIDDVSCVDLRSTSCDTAL